MRFYHFSLLFIFLVLNIPWNFLLYSIPYFQKTGRWYLYRCKFYENQNSQTLHISRCVSRLCWNKKRVPSRNGKTRTCYFLFEWSGWQCLLDWVSLLLVSNFINFYFSIVNICYATASVLPFIIGNNDMTTMIKVLKEKQKMSKTDIWYSIND